MIRVLMVLAVSVALVAGASVAEAVTDTTSTGPDGAGAAAKKAKTCKRSQVRVTVGKRKRACRPLSRFIPRPRAGDTRRISVEGALKLRPGPRWPQAHSDDGVGPRPSPRHDGPPGFGLGPAALCGRRSG